MKALLPLLAAAGLTAAVAAPALAQSPAPVAIVNCAPSAAQYSLGPTQAVVNPVIDVPGSGDFAVTFVNQSPQVITSVSLALSANGQTQTVTDSGAFAPNSETTYQIAGDLLGAADASCTVTAVTYADGSAWHA